MAVLKAETETCMRLLGVESVNQLGPHLINTRAVERDIYDGPSFARSAVESTARNPVPIKAKL
jgi:L-lactate dehydrogenase (cytochrome)